MEPARIFDMVNLVPLPGWLLLAIVPRWRWTPLVTACLLPAALAVVYLGLMLTHVGTVEGGFSNFNSLAGVQRLFGVEGLLLAGWIHYLAFDLFVGSWEVRDAQRQGIHHLLVIPCLILTLMLGPVGLLAYWILRTALRRDVFRGEVTDVR